MIWQQLGGCPPPGSTVPTAGTAYTGEAQRRSKIPEFSSIDEELDFWSKHSILEFMDEGEEVELDFSEARKEREGRRRQAMAEDYLCTAECVARFYDEDTQKDYCELQPCKCTSCQEGWYPQFGVIRCDGEPCPINEKRRRVLRQQLGEEKKTITVVDARKTDAMAEDYLCTDECIARFYQEDLQADYCKLQPHKRFAEVKDGEPCPIDEKRRRVLRQQLGDRRAGTEQWEVDKTQAYEVMLRCSNCGRSFALPFEKGTSVKEDEVKCPNCECVGKCFVEWLTRRD
jgi:hypothetical protein